MPRKKAGKKSKPTSRAARKPKRGAVASRSDAAMSPAERLSRIDAELAALHAAPTFVSRQARRGLMAAAAPARKFQLLADGDSWFDYPLGRDILDYLNNYFRHPV